MALLTKVSDPSMDGVTLVQLQPISALFAGENLDACAPCYIKSSDGKVYMSNGTAANEAAKFHGFTPRACKSGMPTNLYGEGVRMRYGSGLTIGAQLYIGTTKGRLDTTATTGDNVGTAWVVTATEIICNRIPNALLG